MQKRCFCKAGGGRGINKEEDAFTLGEKTMPKIKGARKRNMAKKINVLFNRTQKPLSMKRMLALRRKRGF